jgi:hypothetical protein
MMPKPVDAIWRRSSLCSDSACVEIAILTDGQILVRSSQDQTGPMLRFSSSEWMAFLSGVRNDEFDLI